MMTLRTMTFKKDIEILMEDFSNDDISEKDILREDENGLLEFQLKGPHKICIANIVH
jgi:hypothetical protein